MMHADDFFSALCWSIVALGAIFAVFSPRIQDTVTERIALCAVSLCASGAACQLVLYGQVTEPASLRLSAALALYVLAIVWKKYANLQPMEKL